MAATPKVALIGAGSSGIAAAKALHERSFDFDVYEASDRVGGNWVFGNKNGMSAAYRYLHINTSRERMQYSDFPMPESYPDFPRHDQIAKYFADYVDHFGFRDRIQFENAVERAERLGDGTWEVSSERGGTRRYDMLLVANGHHWDKRWPEPAFPGADEFEGIQMHAHDYVDNEFLRDKDVVVLGMGNSAMDIAVESSDVAGMTYLAARRGAWIIPKYLFGRPLDTLATNPRVPMSIGGRMLEKIVTLHVGRPEKFGLPKPDHRLGQAHPTISGRIHDRITHGKVTPKPNIARLHRDEVEFTDGSRVRADVVIYCTGYKITFPFFHETFISAPDNHIELFWRVFQPEIPNLAFVGLLQPLGAIMPLAEAQGQWIAEYLKGEYHLPSQEAMREHIAKDMEAMRKRYVSSKRHTIQVDFDEYLYKLAIERREGAQRAAAAGFAPQVPATVASGEAVAA
ncbi:MAG TPA: NAD(P)-binding domain-containing protein [Solirubrobacteraceae bacterium]|nr:NAD(P)-binding domain-containing protein [Solirubrobacteraceae bacterium]